MPGDRVQPRVMAASIPDPDSVTPQNQPMAACLAPGIARIMKTVTHRRVLLYPPVPTNRYLHLKQYGNSLIFNICHFFTSCFDVISVISRLGSRRYTISKILVVRPWLEPRTPYSSSQELFDLTTAVPFAFS